MKPEPYFRKHQRLRGFDYASAATYFITICTHDREHTFGDIIVADMALSQLGEIAMKTWDETITLRQELIPHAFIVMPNHVHSLFSLNPDAIRKPVATHCNASHSTNASHPTNASLHRESHSVGTIIGGYKGAVTRAVRTHLDDLNLIVWQARFHDRIVRTEREFNAISQYIETNPARWEHDRFNKPDRNTP